MQPLSLLLKKPSWLDVFMACVNGTLEDIEFEWHTGFTVCVVLVSTGYPRKYKTGYPITGIEKAERIPGVVVFHAGTKLINGQLVTAGGRVLSVTAQRSHITESSSPCLPRSPVYRF